MKDPKSGEAWGAIRLAERQMLLYEARRKLAREIPAAQIAGPHRFITISRDIGALGDVVACELATRLNWQVFDKEIVDYIARHSHVRQDLVRRMDESARSLVHDTVDRLLRMFEGSSFGNEEYREALLRTLVTLAAQGGVILAGHGGAFALQGQPGLHLRITASLETRVARLSRRWLVPPDEARRRVLQIDGERRCFVQYHFKVDREDPRFFDLVLNSDRLNVEQMVNAILGVMRPQERIEVTAVGPAAASETAVPSSPAARRV